MSTLQDLKMPKLDLFCLVPFDLLHPRTVGLFRDLVLCVFGPCHGRLNPNERILLGLPEETGRLWELAVLLLGGHHDNLQDGNKSGERNIVRLLQGIICPLDVLETAELFPVFVIVIVDLMMVIDDRYTGHVGQRQTVFSGFEILI
jgi:hypothetical protein